MTNCPQNERETGKRRRQEEEVVTTAFYRRVQVQKTNTGTENIKSKRRKRTILSISRTKL